MVYYDDISFTFAEPYPVDSLAGLIIFLIVYLALVILNLALLIRNRNNRIVALRGVPALCLAIVSGFIFSVVMVASLLLGKPVLCEVTGFVFATLVPLLVFRVILLQPILLTSWKLNELKETRAHGSIGWHWRLRRYLSPNMQLFYIFALAVIMTAIYCAVHFSLSVRPPGDCNRDSQVILSATFLLLLCCLPVFAYKLSKIKDDPLLVQLEVRISIPCSVPFILLRCDPTLLLALFFFFLSSLRGPSTVSTTSPSFPFALPSLA